MGREMDRLCYPVPEAAQQLGIGERTLWRYVRDQKIKTVRLGGRVLVPRSELENLIAENLDDTGAPVREAPPHIKAKAAKC